jgi:hypothetical protein
MTQEVPGGDPNYFTHVNVWYSDEPLVITEAEQAILAESAARYGQFARAVTEVAPAAKRKIEGTIQASDPYPLGGDEGLDSIAYRISVNDQDYVVRFSKGPNPQENVDTLKARLRHLARAQAFQIPYLEQLTTYSAPDDAIVTEWAKGKPSSMLSLDDIDNIPDSLLLGLQETATGMQAAGLALDIMWGGSGIESEEPFERVVAHYDTSTKQPTYFDVTDVAEELGRENEAGRHYAELLTTLVATGAMLDPGVERLYAPFSLTGAVSVIKFLDRGYRMLQEKWPHSSGLGWLERTAGRIVQDLPPSLEIGTTVARVHNLTIPLDYRQDYGE